MIPIDRLRVAFPRATALVEPHFDVLRKAVSFASIGVINVAVDFSVFLYLAIPYLESHAAVLRPLDALAQWCTLAQWCAFASPSYDKLVVGTANVASWVVAVSGSYVMNSFITFAAESGRRLRWLDYGRFAASGVLGVITSTAVVVVATDFMPRPAAKGCAILAAFVVNFSMSHFVVFRPRRHAKARDALRPRDLR